MDMRFEGSFILSCFGLTALTALFDFVMRVGLVAYAQFQQYLEQHQTAKDLWDILNYAPGSIFDK